MTPTEYERAAQSADCRSTSRCSATERGRIRTNERAPRPRRQLWLAGAMITRARRGNDNGTVRVLRAAGRANFRKNDDNAFVLARNRDQKVPRTRPNSGRRSRSRSRGCVICATTPRGKSSAAPTPPRAVVYSERAADSPFIDSVFKKYFSATGG